MDARSDKNAIPLAVDLDGTLIATDLLWEGLFLLLRKNPLYLFLVPFWLAVGPGAAEAGDRRTASTSIRPRCPIARRCSQRLRDEHAAGRKIVLATGTPRKFAEAIAAHLGMFDAVLATDGLAQSDLGPQARRAGRGLWRRRLRLCRQQPPRPQGLRRRARGDRRGARPSCRALAGRAWRRN